jgi:hypothetical protein
VGEEVGWVFEGFELEVKRVLEGEGRYFDQGKKDEEGGAGQHSFWG